MAKSSNPIPTKLPPGMLAIQKDIPIPPKAITTRLSKIYPFEYMQIGDSFFIENVDDIKKKRASLANYVLKKGFKIASREEEGGLRVWLMGMRDTKTE